MEINNIDVRNATSIIRSGSQEKLFGLKVDLVHIFCRGSWDLEQEGIAALPQLLLYGKIGSDLYDLAVMCTYTNDLLAQKLKRDCLEFARKYTFAEYLVVFRKLYLTDTVKGSELSRLTELNAIMWEAYNLGCMDGINLTGPTVGYLCNKVSPLTMALFMQTRVSPSLIVTRVYQDQDGNQKSDKVKLKLSRKNETRVLLERQRMGYDILFGDEQAATANPAEIVTRLVQNGVVWYITQSLSFQTKEFFPSDLFSTYALIEREKWTGSLGVEANNAELLYEGLLHLIPADAGKKRDIFLREKGVILSFNETIDNISCLLLGEYHSVNGDLEEHLLSLTYQLSDGSSRTLVISLDKLHVVNAQLLFEIDITALLLTYAWLGLFKDITEENKEVLLVACMGSFPEADKEELEGCIALLVNAAEQLNKITHDENTFYYEPTQWNYNYTKNSSKPREFKKNKVLSEDVKVSGYIRKLPEGQKASEEAKMLARKYFLELEEGTTFVKEFTRTSRGSKIMNLFE